VQDKNNAKKGAKVKAKHFKDLRSRRLEVSNGLVNVLMAYESLGIALHATQAPRKHREAWLTCPNRRLECRRCGCICFRE
jgi:hypothetical protein